MLVPETAGAPVGVRLEDDSPDDPLHRPAAGLVPESPESPEQVL